MQIIEMKVGELIPYENNPRRNEEAVKYVANSIREFGFRVPIIVDRHNVIVAGHTRVLAAKELGLETVPVILADDLTDEELKAFRVADNKTAEIATWDAEALEEELREILDKYDMTDFGFGEIDLTALDDIAPTTGGGEKSDGKENNARENQDGGTNRVIITYPSEEEDKVCRMLGVQSITKSIYNASELI